MTKLPIANSVKLAALCIVLLASGTAAEIPKPADAPKPLSAAEAAKSFRLPAGYAMRLIAAEPLIHEPTGVCWDEHGRMFVTELHGYNVEGQYEIDELNKTGQLDLEVRRIQAGDAAKKKAEADNFGTVKLLLDSNGDGVMDQMEVWADRLPLCYGVVPARGGVIVACPPDILYLSDSDGDNRPDVRETLFTGFGVGQPERGVNAPTWGVDNWIYFGRGHSGGTITGAHLKKPVMLGNTDFRIRADGSAIEPVTGSTKTIGMAFTEGGDRFVTTTTSPGLFVTPIPAPYFSRNPDAPAPLADANAADYNQVFPLAPPHPWRVKREQHSEYFSFYKKISLSDAAASGYFTSACGPLVYNDPLMPELRGQYLVCEPAQNLVHRGLISRDGPVLYLKRSPAETKSEFLASTDAWFHPVSLHPAPDGSIAVVDFYREIIEDYSAIPRHLQQQYGVINGRDRGRIWLLTREGHQPRLNVDMASLDNGRLASELRADIQWRRLTARRLLIERRAFGPNAKFDLPREIGPALATLYAFEGCGALTAEHLLTAWQHETPEVRVHALRIADRDFKGIGAKVQTALLTADAATLADPGVALQAALSLGNSPSAAAIEALAKLAATHGKIRWMDSAIASSTAGCEPKLLQSLASKPLGNAQPVIEMLASVIATRGDPAEIAAAISDLEHRGVTGRAINLLKLGLDDTKPVENTAAVPAPMPPNADQLREMEKRLPAYVAALNAKPDMDQGRALFTAACGACHRSHGIGIGVGPELDAEFQRAPEVILRDILFPHEAQRPGFETVVAKTQRGETLVGIAASDSPTSITLRLQGGSERTLLRKRTSISILRNVSVMPFGLAEALQPSDIANIIAFLRQPPAR